MGCGPSSATDQRSSAAEPHSTSIACTLCTPSLSSAFPPRSLPPPPLPLRLRPAPSSRDSSRWKVKSARAVSPAPAPASLSRPAPPSPPPLPPRPPPPRWHTAATAGSKLALRCCQIEMESRESKRPRGFVSLEREQLPCRRGRAVDLPRPSLPRQQPTRAARTTFCRPRFHIFVGGFDGRTRPPQLRGALSARRKSPLYPTLELRKRAMPRRSELGRSSIIPTVRSTGFSGTASKACCTGSVLGAASPVYKSRGCRWRRGT